MVLGYVAFGFSVHALFSSSIWLLDFLFKLFSFQFVLDI